VSSKLILPLIAGFALCVAGSVAARAESTSSNETAAQTTDSQTKPSKKKVKKHPNKTELDKLERGNPHSVYYKSRRRALPTPRTNRSKPARRESRPAWITGTARSAPTTRPAMRSTLPRREIRTRSNRRSERRDPSRAEAGHSAVHRETGLPPRRRRHDGH